MSVPAVTAPFLAATAMLGLAGVAKAMRPGYTARALQVAGLSAGRATVRAGALVEVAVSVAALAEPNAITGSLVAASYAGFALFVAVALWKGWPLSTCGCFARRDSTPGVSHLALDVGAAVAAALWAANPPLDVPAALSRQPWDGWPLLFVSAVVAVAAFIVWTDPLAQVRRQRR